MPDIWLGILNRFVEKLLNVKGGPTVTDFEPSVRLVLPILVGVEERYHQGWSRFAGSISVTGGAGQSAAAMLHNPLSSNAIGVVERLAVRGNNATSTAFSASFQAGPAGIADLTTIQTPSNLDGRSTTGATLVFSTTTAGAPFARQLFVASQTNQVEIQFLQTHNQEIPLIPGSAIILLDQIVADSGTFSFMWRERPLESSELT